MNTPLVSAIIPCYNQAHFLSNAIESLVAQTHPNMEIIVVDDGSTDNSAELASGYPNVVVIRQVNLGLSNARNTGIRMSSGDFLVFLDADDRLLENAVSAGYQCFENYPESAFVWGRHLWLARDGIESTSSVHTPVDGNAYANLLRGNYICMHATVLYRRHILLRVGGFDETLNACEDYDLYLRIAREHQIAHHDQVVAVYHRHTDNMSHNTPMMLESALSVLRSQKTHVKSLTHCHEAYKAGMRVWKEHYGLRAMRWIMLRVLNGEIRQAGNGIKSLIKAVGIPQLMFYTPIWLIKYWLKTIKGRIGT